jgi:hypothetical protein
MKTFRTQSGPFSERPHFEPGEIDRICADELRKAGFYPDVPGPVRIDRFVEKRFGVVPQYEELPHGVLGYTKFGKLGVDAIVISAALDADGGKVAERRLRTTLAHEAGHGLLHAYLFALEDQALTLFDAESRSKDKVLCRDVQGEGESRPSYDGRWWEFQANRAIGGLLMPRRLVETALGPYLVPSGSLGGIALGNDRRAEAERALAELFEVNPVVARIRIGDLNPPQESGQLKL